MQYCSVSAWTCSRISALSTLWTEPLQLIQRLKGVINQSDAGFRAIDV